jgi:hypothetical protein
MFNRAGFTPFIEQFPSEENGVQILFGIESGAEEDVFQHLPKVSLRILPDGDPPTFSDALPGLVSPRLAGFAQAVPPGSHQLFLQWPGQDPIIMALQVLRGHVTTLVIYVDEANRVQILQYLPALDSERSPSDDHQSIFGTFSESERLVYGLELAQRFYLGGRADYAYQYVQPLLEASREDPIASCLAGYLLLKLGRVAELEEVLRSVPQFEELADVHVLRGVWAAARGRDDEAATAFQIALEQGIPIFTDGLLELGAGVERYRLDHPRVSIIEASIRDRIHGLLWSAWSPHTPSAQTP